MQAQKVVDIRQPKYYAVPPRIVGEITLGIEKFADNLEEARQLHYLHYQETEVEYMSHDYNPNYDSYIDMEKDGRFVQFTVRIGLKMVGYLLYYIFRDQHSQQVYQAREDAFFLHPLVRGKKIAPQLLAYAEDALRALGCHYVGMTSKAPVGAPDIGPFLERRGYKPVAMFYVKTLES